MSVTVSLQEEKIEVQRIFCIGRNYAAHAAELGNEVPEEPVVFMKPPTAIVVPGRGIRLPRNRGEVHHEAELVLLIERDTPETIPFVAGVTLGLDLTLREEQSRLKARGLPWELAKAFDDSAPLGEFVKPLSALASLAFDCFVNGEHRQHGDPQYLLFPAPHLVKFLDERFHLRRGDLVFTGTPKGVAALNPGDAVVLESPQIGRFEWNCA